MLLQRRRRRRCATQFAWHLNDFASCSIEWKLKYTYVYIECGTCIYCLRFRSETSCPECPECPESHGLLLRLPLCVHVRVRVHAYKSLAFAFSPYQAIRIFYFNLITPNGFKLLLSLPLSLPFSLSVCFCFCLALCFGICHVAGLVFVINLNLPPHSHTSAGCQLSTGPARSARLECWHPGCCPIPPRPLYDALFTFATLRTCLNERKLAVPHCASPYLTASPYIYVDISAWDTFILPFGYTLMKATR